MSIYKPTYLYIKKHNVTGLQYFGKTIRNPLTYKGSGKYWNDHLKIHGNDISTEWYQLFNNENELTEYATNFSIKNNIVESKSWANLVIENGINSGGVSGIKRSEETKKKIAKARTGKATSDETKEKISKKLIGKPVNRIYKPKSDVWYKKHAETHKGKPNHLR
jgi:hypothetical protein